MSLKAFTANRSISVKIGAGLVSLAALAAVVGSVGYYGLDRLGLAVNLTGQSAAVLADVNDAVDAVNAFIQTREPAAVDRADNSLGAVEDGLGRLGKPSDPSLALAYSAIQEFHSAIAALVKGAGQIAGANQAIEKQAAILQDVAHKLQSDAKSQAIDQSMEAETQLDRRLDAAQFQAIAFQAQGFAAQAASLLNRYAEDHDAATLSVAKAAATKANGAISKINSFGSSYFLSAQLQDSAAGAVKLINALAKIEQAQDPADVETLRGQAFGAIDKFVASTDAVVKAAVDLAAEAEKLSDEAKDAEETASDILDLGVSLGDTVDALTIQAATYRSAPSAAIETTVKDLLAAARDIGQKVAKSGLPDPSADIEGFGKAFANLVSGSKAFSTARDTAVSQANAVVDAVGQISRKQAAFADRSGAQSSLAMLITIGVALLFALIVGFGLSRLIASPIIMLTAAMRRLATGDTNVTFNGVVRTDEIGDMLGAIRVFRDNAIERRRLTQENEAVQAARASRQQTIEQLIEAFRTEIASMINAVAGNADQMEGTAQALATIADEANRRAQVAAGASEQASESVQTVAAAAEELSASITEISRQTETATNVARQASAEAQNTDATISSLAASAERIGDVISLIRAIAEQTNLLALNATIEAARAGEAGKGFAVVAGEVKSLANQTSRATEEIASQISEIQVSTERAVAAIRSISGIMSEVDHTTSVISSAVYEQGSATAEISTNAQRAANGTRSVAGETEALTRVVGETKQSASLVLSVSNDMNAQAHRLREIVERFIYNVMAA